MNEKVVAAVGISFFLPVVVCGVLLSLHTDARLRLRGHLVMATGYAGYTVVCVLLSLRPLACLMAGLAAWFLYSWWNGGGGDGLKRRMKSLTTYLGFGPAPARQSV